MKFGVVTEVSTFLIITQVSRGCKNVIYAQILQIQVKLGHFEILCEHRSHLWVANNLHHEFDVVMVKAAITV